VNGPRGVARTTVTFYEPNARDAAFNVAHLLGADLAGRDVLARVVFGTQVSLLVGFGAVTI